MDYSDYIMPELLVLIPVLYILGEIVKSTERIDDRYIPLTLGVASIVLSAIYVSSTQGIGAMALFTSFVQGVLVAGCAVYANQIYKQATRRDLQAGGKWIHGGGGLGCGRDGHLDDGRDGSDRDQAHHQPQHLHHPAQGQRRPPPRGWRGSSDRAGRLR